MYYDGAGIDEDIWEEVNNIYGGSQEQVFLHAARRQNYRNSQETDFYAGPNRKVIEKRYAKWVGESKRAEYLSKGKDEVYLNAINELFRPGSFIGDGSAAAIYEFEKTTGVNCGRNGGNHLQKCEGMIKYIKNKVLQRQLSEEEKTVMNDVLTELERVTET